MKKSWSKIEAFPSPSSGVRVRHQGKFGKLNKLFLSEIDYIIRKCEFEPSLAALEESPYDDIFLRLHDICIDKHSSVSELLENSKNSIWEIIIEEKLVACDGEGSREEWIREKDKQLLIAIHAKVRQNYEIGEKAICSNVFKMGSKSRSSQFSSHATSSNTGSGGTSNNNRRSDSRSTLGSNESKLSAPGTNVIMEYTQRQRHHHHGNHHHNNTRPKADISTLSENLSKQERMMLLKSHDQWRRKVVLRRGSKGELVSSRQRMKDKALARKASLQSSPSQKSSAETVSPSQGTRQSEHNLSVPNMAASFYCPETAGLYPNMALPGMRPFVYFPYPSVPIPYPIPATCRVPLPISQSGTNSGMIPTFSLPSTFLPSVPPLSTAVPFVRTSVGVSSTVATPTPSPNISHNPAPQELEGRSVNPVSSIISLSNLATSVAMAAPLSTVLTTKPSSGTSSYYSEQQTTSSNNPNTSFNSLPLIKLHSGMQLWEFLLQMLLNDCYKQLIVWTSKQEGIFRVVDSHSLAQFWGVHKRRSNMTYDKLSRAMRYYYGKDLLDKGPKRLYYQFKYHSHWWEVLSKADPTFVMKEIPKASKPPPPSISEASSDEETS